MSGVPKELDETAYVDGYSFWRFFLKIFVRRGCRIGVACFFCFMFSGRTAAGQDVDFGAGQADLGDDDANG